MVTTLMQEDGVIPAELNTVLTQSDTLFVIAAVTSENQPSSTPKHSQKCALDAILSCCPFTQGNSGLRRRDRRCAIWTHPRSKRWPEEPLPMDHPIRELKGFIRSAHRAGALSSAFKQMGDMVLEDMALMDRDLVPMRCKRAERETVQRFRSRPVTQN